MTLYQALTANGAIFSPGVFALLVALAAAMIWLSLAPARSAKGVQQRMAGYLDDRAGPVEPEMRGSLASRVLWPALRRLMGALGRFLPQRSLERTRQQLLEAGMPGGLTPLDFYGLRLLVALFFGGGLFLLLSAGGELAMAVFMGGIFGLIGYIIPSFWLGSRLRERKRLILRALPNALDMLTVGVQAGLSFEAAMMRVSERWDNALTRELRRAVVEMRVGVPRAEALQRLATRVNVAELQTFVAVLIQSGQLGVSVADVLHTQAALIRENGANGTDQAAREASIKMLSPWCSLSFRPCSSVIIGPALPQIGEMFRGMMGG
jgi:tight adherence protein C